MAAFARLICAAIIGVLLCAGCPYAPSDTAGPGLPDSGGADSGGTGGSSGPVDPIGPPADGAGDSSGTTAVCPECVTPPQEASWRAEVLQLVNRERTLAGVTTLVLDQTLEDQANQYACEMICGDFFDHDNPLTGTTLADRAQQFDYEYQVIGENLAAGQQSPSDVVIAWMNSPGHRANMLDARFTEVGVGVRTGGTYGVYWVLEFGCPR